MLCTASASLYVLNVQINICEASISLCSMCTIQLELWYFIISYRCRIDKVMPSSGSLFPTWFRDAPFLIIVSFSPNKYIFDKESKWNLSRQQALHQASMLLLLFILSIFASVRAAPSSGMCLCVTANRVNVRDAGGYRFQFKRSRSPSSFFLKATLEIKTTY